MAPAASVWTRLENNGAGACDVSKALGETETGGSSSDTKSTPSGRGSEESGDRPAFSFGQEDTEGAQAAARRK